MKFSIRTLAVIILLICCESIAQSKGHLVIIGGGERPDYVMSRIVELAGGIDARILVIPNASGSPEETGSYQAAQFRKLGVEYADFLYLKKDDADHTDNLKKLDGISGVFFSGGDQNRLTADLLGTVFFSKLKELYHSGAVMSGTSAGAAIMSEVMITGDEFINKDSSSAFITIQAGNIETAPGFGFMSNVIVDQHFIKRKRLNRLFSLVIENPSLLGIGIDEETAIVVYPDNKFEVLGENQVMIINGAGISGVRTDKNSNLSASGLIVDFLIHGDKYDLSKRKVVR